MDLLKYQGWLMDDPRILFSWNQKSLFFLQFSVKLNEVFYRKSIQILCSLFKHTVKCEKTRNSLSLKKISSNQLFSNFLSKTIAFTKICEREFLRFPHWAVLRLKIFREIKSMSIVTSLVKALIWRKKCWLLRKNRDRFL